MVNLSTFITKGWLQSPLYELKENEGSTEMAVGKVKWFNNAKGFGFIREEGKDDDIFAHFSTITMDGYKTLKAGQEVEFDLSEGPKGLHATNIKLGEK